MRHRRDAFAVLVLAAAALVLLATALYVQRLPSPYAPRVNVRWADRVDAGARASLERQFSLAAGEQRAETTWSYELTDPSTANIAALVADPAVADTHYIDRARASIQRDAPRGETRLATTGPRVWAERLGAVVDWTAWISASILALSAAWLATARSATR